LYNSVWHSTTAAPFNDDQGQPVLDINGRQMLKPSDVDPRFFVDEGLAALQADALLMSAGSQTLANLINFRIGGSWDVQRVGPGKMFVGAFTDFANVAIGLYGAAAGIPRGTLLSIANQAAAQFSRFAPNAAMHPTYTSLRVVNVYDINKGYDLYQKGQIGPTR
jgi:hypothetical protein